MKICKCGHNGYQHSSEAFPDRYDDVCHGNDCGCRKFTERVKVKV